MPSGADNWWNEDRRELFHSAAAIASGLSDATQLGDAFDTILNDLDLYDDPGQGAGMWLFQDELQLAERLGEEIHDVVGDAAPIQAGALAIGSSHWPNVRATADALLRLMEANGDFTG